jgi:acyl-CoA-binding protein
VLAFTPTSPASHFDAINDPGLKLKKNFEFEQKQIRAGPCMGAKNSTKLFLTGFFLYIQSLSSKCSKMKPGIFTAPQQPHYEMWKVLI